MKRAKAGRAEPALVKQRGYVANRFAGGLRSRGTQTIGFVAPDVVNPFFARLNPSLEDVTRRYGHQLLVA